MKHQLFLPFGMRGIASLLALLCFPAIASAQDLREFHRFLDRDGDGVVDPYEGAEAMLWLAKDADMNGDGEASVAEMRAFLAEDHASELSELGDEFRAELFEFLDEADHDGDGAFALDDLPRVERPFFEEEFNDLDRNNDGLVTQDELLVLVEEELAGATFAVRGTRAIMTGVIGPSTPGRVLELALEHPKVDLLVLADVPGSIDDEALVRAAQLVRRLGFDTHVPGDGEVASGGTDFFLAGVHRSAGRGARFGVHSWAGLEDDEFAEGADLPRDHEEHSPYLEYYASVGIPSDFYWFTLEAASAEDIHWMTAEELARFGFVTNAGRAHDGDSIEAHLAEEGIRTVFRLEVVDGALAAATSDEPPYAQKTRQLWAAFTSQLPATAQSALKQIRAIRLIDGDDIPGGFATPIDDPHGDWEIALARDVLSTEGLWVLTHEYGHVLSMGDREVELQESGAFARPVGPRYGDFFDRYWAQTGLLAAIQRINPEGTTDPEVEQEFVSWVRTDAERVPEFVSGFAMVNPEEDFTETFAAYVLGGVAPHNDPVAGGGKAKLAWFAEHYPKD